MNCSQIAGENIRELRKLQGYTLEEFGKYVMIDWSYLASIERGEQNMTLDSLEKIATALRVPPHFLLLDGAYKWVKPAKAIGVKTPKNRFKGPV